MGKKSTKAPDVVGAAEKEGQFSRETARDVTYADRPDQNTAFGNTRWTQTQSIDPATGEPVTKWTQNQTLSPDMQRLFDAETNRNQIFADQSATLAGRAGSEMSEELNWDQFGDVIGFDPTENRLRAEDDAYARSTRRLDPQFAAKRATLERQMADRGLRAGDSAYDSAMRNFDTGSNDAYEMARLSATGEGRQEVGLNLSTNERVNALRQQEIQEYLGKRSQSLSEANALASSMNTGDMAATYGGGE